jgi:ribosomal protein S18 acetylase RimI-like enzyme
VLDIRDATAADVDGVFELLVFRSRAAFGISEVTRSQLQEDLERRVADRWVARAAGLINGYAQLGTDGEFGIVTGDGAVADELLRRIEERARARALPSISITVPAEDEAVHALVRRSGFAVEGETLRMWRTLDGELPSVEVPAGVSIRTYRDADARAIHALLDGAYAGWDPHYTPLPHDEWLAFMTEHSEFDPALWLVAERGADLAGCALHWKEQRGRGWLKDVAVAASERGRGLAKALLVHGLATYAARGAERVGLKVDAANPTGAPQLYARLGFVTDRRFETWRKGL